MISLIALVYNCIFSLDYGAFAIIFSFAELSAEKLREVIRKTKWIFFMEFSMKRGVSSSIKLFFHFLLLENI